MLAYILALAVGLGSVGIYLAAFFFPEVHRKNDFIWSGVGLFYALVLWVCAGRITGGLLLGQVASVALLSWSIAQTLQLRRQLTPVQQQTELPSAEEVKSTVQQRIANLPRKFPQLGKRVNGSATTAKERLQQNLSGADQQPKLSDSAQTTTPNSAGVPEPPTSNVVVPQPTTEQQPAADATNPATAAVPQSAAEVVTEVSEPATTEAEAISPTVDNAATEVSPETTVPTPPHPPSSEVVEAALQDAAEKAESAAPPQSTPDSKEEPN